MRKNKIYAALTIAALSATMFVGCGENKAEATTTTTTSSVEATEEATTEATEEATTEATEEATEEATTEATTEATEEATTEATEGAAEITETVYPFTFTELDGTEVVIESEPEKIVSMGPNVTEILYALGAGDKVVGRTDYCTYPEEVSSVESIGTMYTPDIEKIVSLEPDVVLGSTHFDAEVEANIKEQGIVTAALYDESDYTGVYDIITKVGQIVNKNAEAAEVVASMKEDVSEVVDILAAAQTKPTVYYVVGYGEYGDYTAGGDTFIGGLIEVAGGENIAKEVSGWSYDLESLVAADPEIIVIGTGMKDDFVTQENYKDLTAVKEGKVYEIDNDLLELQGPRNSEGIRALAEIIHPELFTE